jgi:hypothetical protein
MVRSMFTPSFPTRVLIRSTHGIITTKPLSCGPSTTRSCPQLPPIVRKPCHRSIEAKRAAITRTAAAATTFTLPPTSPNATAVLAILRLRPTPRTTCTCPIQQLTPTTAATAATTTMVLKTTTLVDRRSPRHRAGPPFGGDPARPRRPRPPGGVRARLCSSPKATTLRPQPSTPFLVEQPPGHRGRSPRERRGRGAGRPSCYRRRTQPPASRHPPLPNNDQTRATVQRPMMKSLP